MFFLSIPPCWVQLLKHRACCTLCLVKSNASTPLVVRTISLSLSYFCCFKITYSTSYTQLHYTSSYLCLCDQNPFYLFPSIIHTTLITPVLLNLPTQSTQPHFLTHQTAFLWENINSTLGSHQAKCYTIVMCACEIPFPIYTQTNHQQAFLAPLLGIQTWQRR